MVAINQDNETAYHACNNAKAGILKNLALSAFSIFTTYFALGQDQQVDIENYNRAIKLIENVDYSGAKNVLDKIAPNAFPRKDYLFIARAQADIGLENYHEALEHITLAEQYAQDADATNKTNDLKGVYFEKTRDYDSAKTAYRNGTAAGVKRAAELEKIISFDTDLNTIFDSNPSTASRESPSAVGGKKFEPNDIGINLGLGINLTLLRNNFSELLFAFKTNELRYMKNEDLRTDLFNEQAMFSLNAKPFLIWTGLGFAQTQIDEKLYENTINPQITFTLNESDKSATTLALGYTIRNAGFPFGHAAEETDRDGTTFTTTLSQHFEIVGKKEPWKCEAGITLQNENTQGSDFDSARTSFFTKVTAEEIAGFKPYASISYTKSTFEHLNSISDFTSHRKDTLLAFDIGISTKIFNSLELSVAHTRLNSHSNIDAFDYKRGIIGFGITRPF